MQPPLCRWFRSLMITDPVASFYSFSLCPRSIVVLQDGNVIFTKKGLTFLSAWSIIHNNFIRRRRRTPGSNERPTTEKRRPFFKAAASAALRRGNRGNAPPARAPKRRSFPPGVGERAGPALSKGIKRPQWRGEQGWYRGVQAFSLCTCPSLLAKQQRTGMFLFYKE